MSVLRLLDRWLGTIRRRRGPWQSRPSACWLLPAMLAVPVAAVASCQAILGIEEGKSREGDGGSGGAGADAGAGSMGGSAGSGGGSAACIGIEGSESRWSMVLGGTGVDFAHGAAIGGDGAIAVVGEFRGADLHLGEDEDVLPIGYEGTGEEVNGYVALLNGNATVQWVRRLSTSGSAVPLGVAFAAERIVVAGHFDSDMAVYDPASGHDAEVVFPAGAGARLGFLLLFESNGILVGNHAIGGTAGTTLQGIAGSPQGEIVAVGTWLGSLQLDGQGELGTTTIANPFVAKFTGSPFAVVNTTTFESSDAASAMTVAAAAEGWIVGGQFSGALTGASGGAFTASGTGPNGWLGRVELTTNTVSVQHELHYAGQGGEPAAVEVKAVASGPEASALAAVCFEGTLDFGGTPVGPVATGRECAVGSLGSDLTFGELLPRPTNAPGSITSYLVNTVATGGGRRAFGGSFAGAALDFGAAGELSAPTLADAFLVVTNSNNGFERVLSVRDEGLSSVARLAMDRCGTLVAVGSFQSSAALALVEVPSPQSVEGPLFELAPQGERDGFLLVLGAESF